ncbi:hypothetical protein DL546_004587 [Coniochaeta pulveracea]|uniref:HMG box domain-containing protein n=1 Tax=Coniochaeta pulveracea TaxID=177199 RepID=A0A420Y2N2_9PEZI|nr:hypothetical protein DL546_004587 [Coniochaeta pulveracea]
MWSLVRSTAARQLRVGRAATSRVANSFAIPTAYRVVIARRNFTETSGELAPKSDAKETKPKTRRTSTEKPAAKKSKAGTHKKTAKAKKPKAKKAVKAAPKKKRVKKVLTPEEKVKLEIRELKKKALLNEPKKLPDRSWLVYVSQHLKNNNVSDVTSAVKDLAASYKDLAASEIEHLEKVAAQNRLANQAAYRAWVESHSVTDIDTANRARRRLRRIAPANTSLHKKSDIRDDRQPSKPLSAYTMFSLERWQSGDLVGQKATDAAGKIAQEWKSLSDSQRQAFQDSAAADRERYVADVESKLNRTVKSRSPST